MKLKRLPSKLIILTFILMSIATANTFAQNKKISLQGFLKDANGKAIADGDKPMTFKLYPVLSGGTAEWSEDQNVKVYGGVYSAYLGTYANTVLGGVTDFGKLSWGSKTYFVGVMVQGTELTPRTELTFAPYSLGSPKATLADTANVVKCSGAIGDIKYSILAPAKFAEVNGDCWVPLDGRSLATTDKLRQLTSMTAIPDIGGLFIRSQEFAGKANNDPDRDSNTPVPTYQGDIFKSHNHSGNTVSSGAHSHFHTDTVPNIYQWNIQDGSSSTYLSYVSGTNITRSTSETGSHQHTINSDGSSETRPQNLNFWTYIRIN